VETASIEDIFGPVIYSYTRADAIADGDLIDVSTMAREAGIKYPVAITRAAWAHTVEHTPEEKDLGQSETGRLWDVLWMFRCAAGRGGREIFYTLLVLRATKRGKGYRHEKVTLKAICGPGDTPDPVITIMLPDED
jgi:hypothetical protein